MRKIFILQNSLLSFNIDAKKLYNPNKYRLIIIINDFGNKILKSKLQEQFYDKVISCQDFSFETIEKLILENTENSNYFDVVTNAEEAMPVCGLIRKRFGLDKEDYSRFFDKNIMKIKLKYSSSIKIPLYTLFDYSQFKMSGFKYLEKITKEMAFPLFVKPVQLFGSVNLRKLETFQELYSWAELVLENEYYEIDEFIEGTMFHCDSFIKDEKILFTFVSQNSRPCYDFTKGAIKGTIVLHNNHPDSILLSHVTENTLKDLGIPKGGVTHLELIKTKHNEIYFVEIAHRSPGCLIPRMYESHANIDIITSHLLLQIDPEFITIPTIKKYASWTCYPKIPGKIKKLGTIPHYVSSIADLQWNVSQGDIITTYSQFGRDYIGTLFMENDNFENLYDEFIKVNNDNLCQYE